MENCEHKQVFFAKHSGKLNSYVAHDKSYILDKHKLKIKEKECLVTIFNIHVKATKTDSTRKNDTTKPLAVVFAIGYIYRPTPAFLNAYLVKIKCPWYHHTFIP